jgi:hypothetical protein
MKIYSHLMKTHVHHNSNLHIFHVVRQVPYFIRHKVKVKVTL